MRGNLLPTQGFMAFHKVVFLVCRRHWKPSLFSGFCVKSVSWTWKSINLSTTLVKLESRRSISFTAPVLALWTQQAANRRRMGLGGPTQTGGWHQPEWGRWAGEGLGRHKQKRRESDRDVETTQNGKWPGQVFSEMGESAIRQMMGVKTSSHFYPLLRIQELLEQRGSQGTHLNGKSWNEWKGTWERWRINPPWSK